MINSINIERDKKKAAIKELDKKFDKDIAFSSSNHMLCCLESNLVSIDILLTNAESYNHNELKCLDGYCSLRGMSQKNNFSYTSPIFLLKIISFELLLKIIYLRIHKSEKQIHNLKKIFDKLGTEWQGIIGKEFENSKKRNKKCILHFNEKPGGKEHVKEDFEEILKLFSNLMRDYKYGEYPAWFYLPIDMIFFRNILKQIKEKSHFAHGFV